MVLNLSVDYLFKGRVSESEILRLIALYIDELNEYKKLKNKAITSCMEMIFSDLVDHLFLKNYDIKRN